MNLADVRETLKLESLRGHWQRTGRFLSKWGPLILLAFAILYYGQYYRSDLNLGGEGGTAGVIAIRLNDGLKPIVDTFLGYNVMWFYPIAWIFKITGPNEIALRIYFFALCALMAVFGFLTVRRVTSNGWISVGTGILLILIPGMLFRNYMGLLPILTGYCLINAFVIERASFRGRLLAWILAGAALGLTLLIRLDLGFFLCVIAGGLIILYPLGVRGAFLRRIGLAALASLITIAAILAVHLPVYLDAKSRGFAENFVGQYTNQWSFLRYSLEKEILSRGGTTSFKTDAPKGDWIRASVTAEVDELDKDHTRPREDLTELFSQESFEDALFVAALYFPLLIAGLMFAASSLGLLWAIVLPNPERKEAALACLVTLGAALTLFPQYFFFRPDTPHLSEFMCPFLVAMVCASWHAGRWANGFQHPALRLPGWIFIALCILAESVYFAHAWPKESAGTIAASRKRNHEFVGENGVRVLLKRREAERIRSIHEAVMIHSGPDDWVITYPYSPTINFMTNRQSYLHDLYVDNATAKGNFTQRHIADLLQYRPAVVVVDNRDINNTEYSRFRNWAKDLWNFIRSNYVLIGNFGENEIYVRPDKLTPAYQPKDGVNAVEVDPPQA